MQQSCVCATWSCRGSLSLFVAKPFLGREDAAADGDCCADAAVEGPKATNSEVEGIEEVDTFFTDDTAIFLDCTAIFLPIFRAFSAR